MNVACHELALMNGTNGFVEKEITSKTMVFVDENVDNIIIRQNGRLSIRAIAETVKIDKESVYLRRILEENLNTKKSVCQKCGS